MLGTMSIAASGMNAADLRLEAAASNIANVSTTGALHGVGGPSSTAAGAAPYQPLRVNQADVSGGVSAKVVRTNASPIPLFDPAAPYADGNGMVGAPNTDISVQMTDVITARAANAMNAHVLEASSQMQRMLIQTVI